MTSGGKCGKSGKTNPESARNLNGKTFTEKGGKYKCPEKAREIQMSRKGREIQMSRKGWERKIAGYLKYGKRKACDDREIGI